ncbi:MAG: hypothetical protein IKM74_03790 [Bacteroidales bacterium]|nr:hypothetical protein [Bacteroidales bacterium]
MGKSITTAKSFFAFMLLLMLVSCQSGASRFVNKFERFIERVESNASSYSQVEWEQKDEQFQEFVDDYKELKKDLSPDEKRKVGELTIRYYKARVKSFGFGVLGEIGGWLEYIQGVADEIKEDVKNLNLN